LSHPPSDLVILDARNYYESRIGHFGGAVLPNIRKFSYFPMYVEENRDLFKDKQVFMYCTGGIRCERASAYLKELGICSEVYQLEGGIHEYFNAYPNGHFKGKNYVFDDRIALKGNEEKVATCNYCTNNWDDYAKCCRDGCFIVSLCCDECKLARGGEFFCCTRCEELHQNRDVAQARSCPCLCQTERLKYNTVEDFYFDMKKKRY